MSVLVLGLGNPILGDDGVGWRVVDAVERLMQDPPSPQPCDAVGPPGEARLQERVEFDRVSLGGLSLMERLVGFDRAVLIDSIQTRDGLPGTLYRLSLDDLPTLHADSVHDASLKAALALGRQLGADLPEELAVFAIEVVDPWSFGETLSPGVQSGVMPAAEAVLRVVRDPRA
jgi:hydrogenase maturation protease